MKETMILLAICAALTSLVTEALKKTIGDKAEYSANLLAAAVSIAIGAAVSVAYIILNEVAVTPKVCVGIAALIVLSWISAMVGYDKVKQTIAQIAGSKE